MIGNNELRFNEATMVAAMQFWLNDQFKVPPTVTSVKQGDTSAYAKEFIVTIESVTP